MACLLARRSVGISQTSPSLGLTVHYYLSQMSTEGSFLISQQTNKAWFIQPIKRIYSHSSSRMDIQHHYIIYTNDTWAYVSYGNPFGTGRKLLVYIDIYIVFGYYPSIRLLHPLSFISCRILFFFRAIDLDLGRYHLDS